MVFLIRLERVRDKNRTCLIMVGDLETEFDSLFDEVLNVAKPKKTAS